MANKHNFDEIICRLNTSSIKCDPPLYKTKYPNAPDDALAFWIADMDFNTAPCIVAAVKSRAEHGIFGYTDPMDSYYNNLKWWQSTRHNIEIKKEEISLFSGVVSILSHAVRAFTNEGDGIIIQQPVYPPFKGVICENNRKVVNNKLINDNGNYFIDFEDLEIKASDPNNKMLILCNPHNPVGRVWRKNELEKIAEICYRNDVLVVSDEIHNDLILNGNKFVSYGVLDDKYLQNAIICASTSKTFNLAGLVLGYSITKNQQLKSKLDKQHSISHYMVNMFGMEAAIAAYSNEGAEWVDSLCDYLSESAEIIDKFIKENLPKAVFKKPEATYLAWIDCNEYIKEMSDYKERLEKAGIMVGHGDDFGDMGKGYIRWNFACPHSKLKQGLSILAEVLKG